MKKRKIFAIVCLAGSLLASACTSDNRVEISFSWNFETSIETPNPIKVSPGKAYGTLPIPDFERDGFTFDGWNIRRDGKGDNVTESTLLPEDAIDHTLFAKWNGKQYKVSFDLHGGNIYGETTLPDVTVTCGNLYGAMVIPANPTKKLSTFLGWYLNPEGTGEEITFSSKVTMTCDHTLHAVFKETKLDYNFLDESDLDDFVSIYDALELKINNGDLEIKNTSENPRAYMALHSNLRAGTCVEIDAEFVGNAPADEGVRAGMYVYGLTSDDSPISGGMLGDPGVKSTKEEIKNWYYGQGGNNVQAWELEKWNNGHMNLKMNVLEDSCGVYFMFDFGRKQNPETSEIDLNPELWQNNKWLIHSIHIDYADYELLKEEYDFTQESDVDSFIHPQNVKYELDKTDNTLKISKGDTDENSSIEFETQYITKESRVEFEMTYYGEDQYSSSNVIGVFSYGNYPNGKKLERKMDENGRDVLPVLDSDSVHMRYFYWGTYGATNESWAPIRLYNGQKFTFTNYLFEDAYGITLRFKFGTANGYFKISHVKISRQEPISEFIFAKEKELEYLKPSSSTAIALDGDNVGDFLKVSKTGTDTNSITLQRLIKQGQKISVTITYVTDDPVFVNGSNQFTFLIHKAGYNGKRDGSELAVIGNAPWDGGWNSTEYELTATADADCYGFWMQFVFNNVPGSYFRIGSIVID